METVCWLDSTAKIRSSRPSIKESIPCYWPSFFFMSLFNIYVRCAVLSLTLFVHYYYVVHVESLACLIPSLSCMRESSSIWSSGPSKISYPENVVLQPDIKVLTSHPFVIYIYICNFVPLSLFLVLVFLVTYKLWVWHAVNCKP